MDVHGPLSGLPHKRKRSRRIRKEKSIVNANIMRLVLFQVCNCMEMRAFPTVSASASVSESSLFVVVNPSLPSPFHAITRTCQTAALARFTPPRLLCSSSNSNTNSSTLLPPDDDDDDDDDGVVEDLLQSQSSICTDGVQIEMERSGDKGRRIRSRVSIEAPLEIVWNILTDYERLADFIPGLAVSQLLHKTPNSARLFQIGEQKLAFGLKFNAGGIVDCYEKELESLPLGQKRDIEFKMIEGDFQIFEGKWSIEQVDRGKEDDSGIDQEIHTTLSYIVDVKPKLWLPVRLVEGRLCNEIKVNLACIREEARKAVYKTL